MNVWVVGAGGIGCAVGARLTSHADMIFVDSWAKHVTAMRREGLRVDYVEGSLTVPVQAWTLDELEEIPTAPDCVLLCVKSNETAPVVRALLPYLGPSSTVVSLQNCINEEVIAGVAGQRRTVGAVVLIDAVLLGPGHAARTRTAGHLIIGELDGSIGSRVERVAALLRHAVPVEVTAHIGDELWSKLVRNAMFNPVATVTGMTAGELASDDAIRGVCVALGEEAVRVALAIGIKLTPGELFDCPAEWYLRPHDSAEYRTISERYRGVYGSQMTLKSSMLRDVETGRPTEIDFLNGLIVAKGVELGIATPLNAAIVALVKQIEAGRKRPSPSLLEHLAAAW